MRKTTTTIAILAALFALAAPAAFAGGGAQPITDGYYTIIWEMPHAPEGTGENAPWPQTYVAHARTGGLDTKPDLGYLDGIIPACGWFQVDVYKIDSERDRQRLTDLIAAGTLTWPQDSPIYHSSKFEEGTECETTTTIGTTTTSEASTTTTPRETTTTADEESTTTVTSPDTTPTTEPSSTAPSTTTPPAPTPKPPLEELPFTGSYLIYLAGGAGALMGTGAGLLTIRGWRERRAATG